MTTISATIDLQRYPNKLEDFTMSKKALNSVNLADRSAIMSSSGRKGTAIESIDRLIYLLGAPHRTGEDERPTADAPAILRHGWTPEQASVTALWFINTPRGVASIYSYWWNQKNEISIGASTKKQALWCAAWLRELGIKATTKHTRLYRWAEESPV